MNKSSSSLLSMWRMGCPGNFNPKYKRQTSPPCEFNWGVLYHCHGLQASINGKMMEFLENKKKKAIAERQCAYQRRWNKDEHCTASLFFQKKTFSASYAIRIAHWHCSIIHLQFFNELNPACLLAWTIVSVCVCVFEFKLHSLCRNHSNSSILIF